MAREDNVAGLAARHRLPAGAADRLERLLRLLSGDPLAPTAVRDPRGILEEHLADSLGALELDVVAAAGEIVDIGSGAGLPALPLAIALPGAAVTALEANARKTAFAAKAIELCGIPNARAVQARAEAWPEGSASADLVVARALAPLVTVAEYAAPLLRLGGACVAWRGRRDPGAESAASAAAAILGLEPAEIRAVKPFPRAEHRHLHVLVKVAETPSRFPRRPGIARKRPLA